MAFNGLFPQEIHHLTEINYQIDIIILVLSALNWIDYLRIDPLTNKM